MLLQFTVENYLSFAQKAVFSMRASSDKDHPRHIIEGKIPLLRGAAIYGANAAGKSNLVLAMGFARDLVRGVSSIAEVRPFGLCEEPGGPSHFHWHFLHAGKIWNYGLAITSERVVEESLYARSQSGGREKKWFERTTDAEGRSTVSFGDEFLSSKPSSDGQLLKLLGPRTPRDELFLRRCRDNQIQAVTPVFEWFEDVLLIVRAEADYEPLVLEANENESFLQFLSQHIRDAGTGIDEIAAVEVPISEEELETAPPVVKAFLANLAPGETSLKLGVSGHGMNQWRVFRRAKLGDLSILALGAVHRIEAKKKCIFDPEQESEGTQRYLHLLPRLYQLQTRPTVLVVDELERRLHTLLTRHLVNQALNVEHQASSQFIFTTHDTNLLDKDLLRRDEIWLVDKDDDGASSLTSLAEFKIRNDSDYEKGYLLGRFEAIPYLRHTHQLASALQKGFAEREAA